MDATTSCGGTSSCCSCFRAAGTRYLTLVQEQSAEERQRLGGKGFFVSVVPFRYNHVSCKALQLRCAVAAQLLSCEPLL